MGGLKMLHSFNEWRDDHKSHRILMDMIECETDCKRRFGVFSNFARELCMHMAIEERSLYTHLASAPETRRRAAHSILEHQDIEELLETLYAMEIDDPHWLQSFRVMRELIERHEYEEDEAVFRDALEDLEAQDAASAVSHGSLQEQHRRSASAVRRIA